MLNLEKKYQMKIPAPSRLKPLATSSSTATTPASSKPGTAAIKGEYRVGGVIYWLPVN